MAAPNGRIEERGGGQDIDLFAAAYPWKWTVWLSSKADISITANFGHNKIHYKSNDNSGIKGMAGPRSTHGTR